MLPNGQGYSCKFHANGLSIPVVVLTRSRMSTITQSVGDPSDKNPQPLTSPSQSQVNSGSLRTDRFVVMGEALAAGIGNFSLSSDAQQWSFATQMAKQMGAKCPQRLIQAPGIGNLVGFPPLPVRVPAPSQSTVIDQLPPAAVSNLAVPSLTLDDALNLQAVQPLIHRNDAKQTAINLIWGLFPSPTVKNQHPHSCSTRYSSLQHLQLWSLGIMKCWRPQFWEIRRGCRKLRPSSPNIAFFSRS